MNKKNNVTDKNIKIKTTGGTMVNIAHSYAEDKTDYLMMLDSVCHTCDWQK